jgi:hypothetical protein
MGSPDRVAGMGEQAGNPGIDPIGMVFQQTNRPVDLYRKRVGKFNPAVGIVLIQGGFVPY